MIRISVVDSTGESRARLVDTIDGYLRSGLKETALLPRASVRPVSPQEIKFAAAPDICIVGPVMLENDLSEVARIKSQLPTVPVIVQLSDALNSLAIVEQLASLGADDVLSPVTIPQDFLRKLILISRRVKAKNNGRLILVDGGKGGVGVTSVVAALGEAYLTQGKSVALLDLDFESQDLSRFLQARPFVNENLRLLLDEERPITEETVLQAVSRVWQNETELVCMAPVPDSEDLYDPKGEIHRLYVSVIELLDQRYDILLVDVGSAHGILKRALYRIADTVLFVVSNDAASVYASVERLQKIRSSVGAGCEVLVVENEVCPFGLSGSVLRDEFLRASRMDEAQWHSKAIPFCKIGLRWPGSGSTLYSSSKGATRETIDGLAQLLGGSDESEQTGKGFTLFKKIRDRFIKKSQTSNTDERPLLGQPPMRLPVPSVKPLELPQHDATLQSTVEATGNVKSSTDEWDSVSARRFVSGVK